ncbi:MAG TPA: methyltransferase domain-containing protein [Gemmataceae bacterium]|jgi:2-polyprenyl-3-methyl-5-hydroxy-6-metoxy-1,4-benzoquinol methylase
MAALRQRSVVPEEMDRPDLPADRHDHALRGLARLNWWSGSARILWRPIRRLAAEVSGRPLRLLDVACGAGDLLSALAGRARGAGVAVQLHGCDISPTALDHARRRTAGLGVALDRRDALAEPLPAGFDVVTCSLFLHHLADEQAIRLLGQMAAATTRLVLVNDLRRSSAGWLLAVAACRLLTRSPVVHVDGPRSVAAAFTPAEALRLAERAGLRGAAVERRWPFRFLLTWGRARS